MNDAQKRVLVVYSRVGGGHLSAARALAAELESSGKATTRLVDAYLECGRFPATLIPTAYARLARAHPRLWSMVYHGSTSFNPQWVLGPFLKGGFGREIAEFGPDVVVSVLPAINGLLARAANYTGARLEVVLTDWHSVHRFWVARAMPPAPGCVRLGWTLRNSPFWRWLVPRARQRPWRTSPSWRS